MADLGYEDLKRGIAQAPITYLPALLILVVERCVRESVFQSGGLEHVVGRAKLSAALPGAEGTNG